MIRLPTFLAIHSESGELLRIDLLRFVAASGIVIMHSASMLLDQPAWLEPTLSNFRMFVDLFFVISGLVIAKFYSESVWRLDGYLRFLQKRIARLLPLHWATLALYVLLWVATAYAGIPLNEPRRYDMSCLVPNVLLVHAFDVCTRRTFNFVSWSISAEMAMYVLFPLMLVLTRRTKAFTCVLAVAAAIALAALDRAWHGRTFDWGVLRALPSFLFGIGIFNATSLLRRVKGAGIAAAALCLLFIATALLRSDQLILLLLAYACVAMAYSADLTTKPSAVVARVGPLGQLTYSLYMLHPVIMTFGFTIVGRTILHLKGHALDAWAVFLTFGTLPILACASLYYFERPLRRLLSPRTSRINAARTDADCSGDNVGTESRRASK